MQFFGVSGVTSEKSIELILKVELSWFSLHDIYYNLYYSTFYTVKTVTLGGFHLKPIFDVQKSEIFANLLFGPLQHQKGHPDPQKHENFSQLCPPVPRRVLI